MGYESSSLPIGNAAGGLAAVRAVQKAAEFRMRYLVCCAAHAGLKYLAHQTQGLRLGLRCRALTDRLEGTAVAAPSPFESHCLRRRLAGCELIPDSEIGNI
jgi:hypothetical protein